MISEIETLIIQQLEDNERKKREGLRKQIKRKVDIYELILSQGYQIGYTTVCNYIRQKELSLREAYIRQIHQPGEECEFDWAEVKIKIAGQLKTILPGCFYFFIQQLSIQPLVQQAGYISIYGIP
jgi:hypothetical protein